MNKVVFFTLILFSLFISSYAQDRDQEIDELRSQVQTLSEKLDDISSDTPKENKGFLELKNSQTVLSVGGRIQLHSIYAWPEGSFYAAKIPLEKDTTGEDGQLIMSARNSRLWVKTRTPSEYGAIRALIEIDFLGASGTEINTNSHGPRLRHAYLEGAGFIIGQTYSAFNSLVTLDTISFAINNTLVRQPLIRYTIEDKKFAYDISFEQPETTLVDEDANVITPKDDVLPDIVTRVRYYDTWGEMSGAFLARYINQDHTQLSSGNTKSSDSAYAYGLNLSMKIKIYKMDDIRIDAQYGEGMGRYMSYNAYPAGTIDNNGDIDLQVSYGGHIAYRHWWSKNLRSTLALSFAGTDNNLDNFKPTKLEKLNENAYSSQLNLLWTPIVNALVGVEYAKALRIVESGDKGKMDMIILLVRYDF